MKLSELKERIDKLCNDGMADAPVRIPIQPPGTTLGGHPNTAITTIAAGFDWDHGLVFINPEERLYTKLDQHNWAVKVLEDIMYHLKDIDAKKMTEDKFVKRTRLVIENYLKKLKQLRLKTHPDVAELADAPDLGSGAERRGGSSPPIRTKP